MSPSCKKPRPLGPETRTFRDDRLVIVATEDTYAPKEYFALFRNPRVHVRVLETRGGLSAPEHVLERLDGFLAEYQIEPDDELWLMLDTDHWVEAAHVRNFDAVCSEAIKKGVRLAHSNPCFEVWLLFHAVVLAPNEQFARADDVRDRLRQLWGGYSKRKLDPERFPRSAIDAAVKRAQARDENSNDRWPQSTGSHVYRVVKGLLGT